MGWRIITILLFALFMLQFELNFVLMGEILIYYISNMDGSAENMIGIALICSFCKFDTFSLFRDKLQECCARRYPHVQREQGRIQ